MQANLPDQIVLQGEIFSLSHSEVKKGTFHAKMSSIKDRNSMDLTKVENILKRWQEYTEELYNKALNDSDNHCGWSLTSSQTC